MKKYRAPSFGGAFKFPFRHGRRQSSAGGYNKPVAGRPSKSMPQIKQFTKMKAGRPAQDKKGRR